MSTVSFAAYYNLYLPPKMLGMICGVDPIVFIDNRHSKLVLKIKDFKREYGS